MALGNLGLTIPLAKAYGGVGAAIGTAASLIIGNGFLMNWYNHVKVGLDMKFFWKQIMNFVPAFIAPIIFGICINNFFNLNNIFYFLGFGILYVVMFCTSMWLFGMNQYEKDLLGRPIKKLFNRLVR